VSFKIAYSEALPAQLWSNRAVLKIEKTERESDNFCD